MFISYQFFNGDAHSHLKYTCNKASVKNTIKKLHLFRVQTNDLSCQGVVLHEKVSQHVYTRIKYWQKGESPDRRRDHPWHGCTDTPFSVVGVDCKTRRS